MRAKLLLWLLMVFLAARWIPNWHIKNNYKDLISPQAQKVLQQQQALRIEVFATPNSVAAGLVHNFLEPLQAHLPQLTIEYLDVLDNPQLVQSYGIVKQGEMIIHQQDRQFHLSTLSYETFFNGLKKLSLEEKELDKQWIVFLDNINGKSFNASDVTGLNRWLNALDQANYRTVVLPFQNQLKLPDNVKLIVLASPQLSWQENDIDWLQQQIKKGISVLWLADPSTAINQPGLSLLFDVIRTDAFHQGHLVIKDYPQHEINRAFDRPLDLIEVMPYITSDDVVLQNQQGETLASAREPEHEMGREKIGSRLLVVGDSDFLSDAHLNSGGNLEMSYRMIDWLLHQDERVDLPSIGIKGAQIHLQKKEILIFASLTLLILPLLLLVVSVYRWRKNK